MCGHEPCPIIHSLTLAHVLTDPHDHGCVVVHGHTIFEGVDERPNRIGIDTGAYRTGVLTSLGVEGDRRWYLATGEGSAREARRG